MPKRNKYNEEQVSKACRIIDILLEGKNVPQEDLDEIRCWLGDSDKADEKMEAFGKKLLEAIKYERNPEYTPQMWAAIARRLGMDPNLVWKQAPAKRLVPLRRRIALRAAAVLIPFFIAATVGGVWLFRAGGPANGLVAGITAPAPVKEMKGGAQGNAVAVVLAKNATHVLPDNSTVRLGPGSELRHAGTFDGGRRVELTGEAHFNVAKTKGEDGRFTVHTEFFDITVMGTEFDVQSPADQAHSTIALYHGSVEVDAGGETVTMKPTDRLHYDHLTHQTTITTIPYGQLRYDEMPGLVFDKAPIADVFAKLESDFGIRFKVEGEMPAAMTQITGNMTDKKSINDVMALLQRVSGRFDYVISDNEIRIITQTI